MREQRVDLADTRRVQRFREIGDVEFDHPVDRAPEQSRSSLVVERRRAVREPGMPIDPQVRKPARTFSGQQLDRGVAQVATTLFTVGLSSHDGPNTIDQHEDGGQG